MCFLVLGEFVRVGAFKFFFRLGTFKICRINSEEHVLNETVCFQDKLKYRVEHRIQVTTFKGSIKPC